MIGVAFKHDLHLILVPFLGIADRNRRRERPRIALVKRGRRIVRATGVALRERQAVRILHVDREGVDRGLIAALLAGSRDGEVRRAGSDAGHSRMARVACRYRQICTVLIAARPGKR